MKKLRLLKFDSMHPRQFFLDKIAANPSLYKNFSRKEYLDKILSFRSNYSDFYTHNLGLHGFEAEEFLITDHLYIDKVADELFGGKKKVLQLKERLKNKVSPHAHRWEKFVVRNYIDHYKPDVLLIREHSPFESVYWREFSSRSLIVDRIAMKLPWGWSPTHFDLIFTSIEHYQAFFQANDIPSYLFYDGFDKRILNEIEKGPKKYDVTHAGGLGKKIFTEKTKLFEYIASNFDLYWWGWGKGQIDTDSPLHKVFRGFITGLEMYTMYHQSRIVLNDYGNVAAGLGVNQRIYEVLGIGSFLLTRHAENLASRFPKDIFVMFKDDRDCLDKINYFLKNEKEREEIAQAGQKYAMEHFAYDKLMGDLSVLIHEHWQKKFVKKTKAASI